jgi:hypothetical protein
MRLVVALSALCFVAALGCDKKEAPPVPAEPPVAAAPAPASTPAAAEPVVDVDSLPVEEQYEAEAETEITAANLTAKLDELEKEISAP